MDREVTYANAVADVIGRRFEERTKNVDRGSVIGPLGLKIPLQWSYSHGHANAGYKVVCWKVSGQLYMAVAFEHATRTTTVILMNKAKLAEAFGYGTNLVSASTRGASAHKFRTLDGYIEWFKTIIVGVWTRSGLSAEYTKIAL